MSRRMSRTSRAISRTRRQLDARPWIKIKNEPVRVLRLAVGTESPLRNVDLQSRQLSQPGQRCKIIDHWVVVVVIAVRDRCSAAPSPASRPSDPC